MMNVRKNMGFLTEELLGQYERYLKEEERSRATVEKYLRDVRKFQEYLCLLGGDESGGKEAGKYLSLIHI